MSNTTTNVALMLGLIMLSFLMLMDNEKPLGTPAVRSHGAHNITTTTSGGTVQQFTLRREGDPDPAVNVFSAKSIEREEVTVADEKAMQQVGKKKRKTTREPDERDDGSETPSDATSATSTTATTTASSSLVTILLSSSTHKKGPICQVEALQRNGHLSLDSHLQAIKKTSTARKIQGVDLVQEVDFHAQRFITHDEMKQIVAGNVDPAISSRPMDHRFNGLYKSCMTYCLFSEFGCDVMEVEAPQEEDIVYSVKLAIPIPADKRRGSSGGVRPPMSNSRDQGKTTRRSLAAVDGDSGDGTQQGDGNTAQAREEAEDGIDKVTDKKKKPLVREQKASNVAEELAAAAPIERERDPGGELPPDDPLPQEEGSHASNGGSKKHQGYSPKPAQFKCRLFRFNVKSNDENAESSRREASLALAKQTKRSQEEEGTASDKQHPRGAFTIILKSSFLRHTDQSGNMNQASTFAQICHKTVFGDMLRRPDEAPVDKNGVYLTKISEEGIAPILNRAPFSLSTVTDSGGGGVNSERVDEDPLYVPTKQNRAMADKWFDPFYHAVPMEHIGPFFADVKLKLPLGGGPHDPAVVQHQCFMACLFNKLCVTVMVTPGFCRLSNRLPKEIEGPLNAKKSSLQPHANIFTLALNKAPIANENSAEAPSLDTVVAAFEKPQKVSVSIISKSKHASAKDSNSFIDLRPGAMPWSLLLTTTTSLLIEDAQAKKLAQPIELKRPEDCMLQCARYTRCLGALHYASAPQCHLLGLPIPPLEPPHKEVQHDAADEDSAAGTEIEGTVQLLRLKRGGVRTAEMGRAPTDGVGNRHMIGILAAVSYTKDRAIPQAKTSLAREVADDLAYSLEPFPPLSPNKTMKAFQLLMAKGEAPQTGFSGYVHDVPQPIGVSNMNGAWKGTRVFETILSRMAQSGTSIDDYDWFVCIDDDSFLVMDNVNWLLDTMSNPLRSATPIAMGKLIPRGNEGFISGSSGIFVNKAAMKLLQRVLQWCINHESLVGYGDMRLGQCLRVASGFVSSKRHRSSSNSGMLGAGRGGRDPSYHFGPFGTYAQDIAYDHPADIRLIDIAPTCFLGTKMVTDADYLKNDDSCQFPFAFHTYKHSASYADTQRILEKARKLRDRKDRRGSGNKFTSPLRRLNVVSSVKGEKKNS